MMRVVKLQDFVRQGIRTRFHGPTNTRGSRYSATATCGERLSLPADDRLGPEENHRRVAEALQHKLHWNDFASFLVGCSLPGGDYAWVGLDPREFVLEDRL